ncbi:hypothetical protein Tco_0699856 [Tanacetum coccineum]
MLGESWRLRKGYLRETLEVSLWMRVILQCERLCSLMLLHSVEAQQSEIRISLPGYRGETGQLLVTDPPRATEEASRSVEFKRISLTGFAAALAFLVTERFSEQGQLVDTSLIHIESRKSPTKSLFDVGSRRISIFTVNV